MKKIIDNMFDRWIDKNTIKDGIYSRGYFNEEDVVHYKKYTTKMKIEVLWNNFTYSIKNIPQKIEETIFLVKHGYPDIMLWNLDDHLTFCICHGIKHMMDNRFGHPCRDGIESIEDWNKILQKIYDGFITFDGREVNYHLLSKEEQKEIEDKRHEAFILLEEYYQNLWN